MIAESPVKPAPISRAAVVIVLTGFSKAAAMLRDMVMASRYGASGVTDAFFVAFTLPMTLLYVLGIDLLRGMSASIFSGLRARNETVRLHSLFSSLLNWTSLLSLVVILVALWQMPGIIGSLAPNFNDDQKMVAISLGHWIISLFYFLGIGNYFTASLNAFGRFYLPAGSLFLANLVPLLSLWVWGNRFGIVVLGYGFFFGFLCGCAIQFFYLLRSCGIRYQPFYWCLSEDVRHFLAKASPLLGMTLIAQVCTLIERSLASRLPAGSLSALGYANKINQLAVELCVLPLASVVLPLLSQLLVNGADKEYGRQTIKAVRYLVMLLLPIVATLILLPETVVAVVYERGHFAAGDRVQTASALWWYALGLLPQGAVYLGIFLFLAHQRTRWLALAGTLSYFTNIILLYILVPRLQYVGVCVAANSGIGIYLIMLLIIYHREIQAIPWRTLPRQLTAIVFAGIGFASVLILLHTFLAEAAPWCRLFFSFTGGSIAYILIMAWLKVEEWRELLLLGQQYVLRYRKR